MPFGKAQMSSRSCEAANLKLLHPGEPRRSHSNWEEIQGAHITKSPKSKRKVVRHPGKRDLAAKDR